jgi:class II lanthipeptide synthase
VSDSDTGDFNASLGCLVASPLVGLAAQLGAVTGLGKAEREVLLASASVWLRDSVARKVSRVLVLELNAARITGRLTGASSAERWAEFLALSSKAEFWAELAGPYPTLSHRLDVVIGNQCAAAVELGRRFAEDRSDLAALLGMPAGELTGVEFGAGDSHRGGRTVATLRLAGGASRAIVYKPRSVTIDTALARLLDGVLGQAPALTRIRVPAVLARDGYGWAEHVEHRYCDGESELRDFYRGIGHWLAVMRLVGGSDLHSENLIACGPVPVIVDCETLFTPHPEVPATGLGLAVDKAAELVNSSVLRTGLLPGRGLALGWRGVDASGVGALRSEQPSARQPVIVGGGSDVARVDTAPLEFAPAANHPSADPVLARYWDRVLAGFDELTSTLVDLDVAGELAPLLAEFADCPMRIVVRPTEVYAELARMLWHPVSLHDEPAAVARAVELLTGQAKNIPGAPSDPTVVEAEVADLLHGDVPFFATTVRRGTMVGPRATMWGPQTDLVDQTLNRWRTNDVGLDRQVIQAALVSAYLNEGGTAAGSRLVPPPPTLAGLDRRRRELAASIVGSLVDAAVHGEDGTASWIAPVLGPVGWAVQPLGPDLYGGMAGLALLFTGYLTEVAAGRADEVKGLDELLPSVLRTMRYSEDRARADRGLGVAVRPDPPGGYVGLGSRIWCWLALERMGVVGAEELDRACALAALMPEAVAEDQMYDLLIGRAGAIVPLLALAARTADDAWLSLAGRIGDDVVAAATVVDGKAWWENPRWPAPLGGFAHGASGIGWALARLAAATGREDFAAIADATIRYEDSLYDENLGGWQDLRGPEFAAAAWCHGAGGIGMVAAERLALGGEARDREAVRRAAVACWSIGMGWTHTLCHGDLGNWELLEVALAAGLGPPGLDRDTLDARIIGSLERHGPVSGMARDAFAPGLLTGIGGMAYHLLRMHPDCRLPSVLLPDAPHLGK